MKEVKQVTKYNQLVYSNIEMDDIRKEECLCLNCSKMGACATAKALYKICCDDNVAMLITRCPKWEKK